MLVIPIRNILLAGEMNLIEGISLGFMLNARVGGIGVSATQAVMDYYGVSKTSAALG